MCLGVPGRVVQRLKECGVDQNATAGPENPPYFRGGALRRVVVLKGVHGQNQFEGAVTEGQRMGISEDVGIPEDPRLDLDHVREPFAAATGAQVEN